MTAFARHSLFAALLVGSVACLSLAAAKRASAAPDNTLGMALLSATVQANGSLLRGSGATTALPVFNGLYRVVFDRVVDQCWFSATPAGVTSGASFIEANPGDPTSVDVSTYNASGALTNHAFHLLVLCAR